MARRHRYTKQSARMARNKTRPPPEPRALDPLPPGTQTILRHGAEAATYHIPISLPSLEQPILKTTISLPARSTWTSGLHFHTSHKEYLRLIQGCIFVDLNGHIMFLSAKAGGQITVFRSNKVQKNGLEIEVDMYARHNWGRATEYLRSRRFLHGQIAYPEDADDEVIVEEWTDPADICKPIFFWNLNGVITASQDMSLTERQGIVEVVFGSWWIPFQLFVIFWKLDNWPIFVRFNYSTKAGFWNGICTRLELSAEYFMTSIVLRTATLLSKILGVQAVSQKRTPEGLWNAYQKNNQ